ncbi:MAG: hypothetical protein ACRDRL_05340 [Sciscionella sp.]
MAGRKVRGCCSLCHEPQHEVISTDEHGDPRRLGRMLPTWRRAHLVLVNGHTTTATVCSACAMTVRERLPELWANAMRAAAHERSLRGTHPSRPHLAAGQHAQQHEELKALVANVPVGVLMIELPKETQDVRG